MTQSANSASSDAATAVTYRWLARKSLGTRKPRHVFVGSSPYSACTYAVREANWDAWQPDAERTSCRLCEQFLARKAELVEVHE
jgi:hypothetical protein